MDSAAKAEIFLLALARNTLKVNESVIFKTKDACKWKRITVIIQ